MSQELLSASYELHAATRGDSLAIKEENASVTYEQLKLKVDGVLDKFQLAGLQSGDVAAVLMPPGINWVTVLLSLLKLRSIYLPLSNSYPDRKIQDIYAQTRFRWLIISSEYLSRAQTLLNTLTNPMLVIIVLDGNGNIQKLQPGYIQEEERVLPVVEDCSYIIYTSGSTGAGKAIAGTDKGIAHFVDWQAREFNLDENCRVSQLSSIVFDASFRDVFLPLKVGGTLYIPDEHTRNNMSLLLRWLIGNKISLVHCVPSFWKLIMKQLEEERTDPALLESLQHIFLAGEPLYAGDVQRWRAVAGSRPALINLYGTSETTMAKTFYRIKEVPANQAQILPVGKPIDNTAIAIISHNRLCGPGELGEIYIKTPYWSRGYYNDEELTRSVFVQNPLVTDRADIVYRTGDIGRYLEDHTIEVLGRVDDQVKVNGIRVELGEIEQAVLRMPEVEQVLVKTRKGHEGEVELVCYYTGKQIHAEALREYLKTVVVESLVPAYFVFLSEFPLTVSGKIDKKALPDPEEAGSAPGRYEPPQGNMEISMETIWKEVLKKRQVGRNESFFTIGGNSLKAIQLISRISKEFKVQVKVVEIFNNQTIAKLSALVSRLEQSTFTGIPLSKPRDYYDLSHAQRRLWALYRLNPESYAYNIPQAFRINGHLDVEVLSGALKAVVWRHEILRTNIVMADGKPQQLIHRTETAMPQLELIDLADEKEPEPLLRQKLQEAAFLPFDLSEGRLFRMALYRLAATDHVLFFNMHHIITDEWSEEILFSELLYAYQAIAESRELSWPPLSIQYKDFADWQNRYLEHSRHQHQAFWLSALSGKITDTPLPYDFPRPDVRTAAGGRVTTQVAPDVSGKIQSIALENGTGAFVTLLTAIQILVYRFTNHRQVIIGTPWTCRNRQELEAQIGFYVNTLPVCVELDPGHTFNELLRKVREFVAGAAQHQEYPFDMLLEDLKIGRKNNRSPIFDIGFTWHDPIGITAPDAGLAIIPYELDFNGIKSDLWFHGSQKEGVLHLSLEYSGDLFREATACMLLESLKSILLCATQDPGLTIQHIISGLKAGAEPDRAATSIEFSF